MTTRARAPQSHGPVQTPDSLAFGLRELGIAAGQVVLVHASLRQLGWVDGGATTVAAAIRDVIGGEGTIVVPTMTTQNSDSSRVHLDRIVGLSPAEVERYRADMPAFDPAVTPSVGMGWLAETVRTLPGAVRSEHPQSSFAAHGPMAAKLMDGHRLDSHHGEFSPLARMYDADARILLLGVGYDVCTAFHLAEYRYRPNPPRQRYRCVIAEHGVARWREYGDVSLDDRDFAALGADLDQTSLPIHGQVGDAICRSVSVADVVNFAARWMRVHRPV